MVDAVHAPADPNSTSFDFAIMPAAVPAATAGAGAGPEAAAGAEAATDTVVLAAPVTPLSASFSPRSAPAVVDAVDPFGTAAAAAAEAEGDGGSSSSRAGSRAPSTSLGSRAAGVRTSSGNLQKAGSQGAMPTPAAEVGGVSSSTRVSERSTLTEGGSEAPGAEGLVDYAGPLGPLDGVVPAADAEVASTGEPTVITMVCATVFRV